MERKRKDWRTSGIHNTAPLLAQIDPDLSMYQNPISELYVRPSRHQHVPWLTEPQFSHCLAEFQSTRPSQSLTTEGSARPRKGNSSSLSSPANSSGPSKILMGDSAVPSSTLIGFSGVPGTGIGGGGGEGDRNGGRTGKGLGEGSRARPLWFLLKCILSRHDFFACKTSSKSIMALAFCFFISRSIRWIVEWMWLMVNIF